MTVLRQYLGEIDYKQFMDGANSGLGVEHLIKAFDAAFEFLADAASPTFHPLVRDAKDVAAGAVLVTAVGAAIVGLIIFWPHVATLFS